MPVLGELAEKGVAKLAGSAAGEMFGESFRSMESRVFQDTDVGKYVGKLLGNYRQDVARNEVAIAKQAAGTLTSGEVKRQAAGMARTSNFAKNDKILAPLIQYSHQTHGYMKTQNLMDAVAMTFKEDEKQFGYEHVSPFKVHMHEAIGKLPEFAKDPVTGERKPVPYTKTTDYHRPGTVEKYVTNFVYSRFSPLIAIPHIGTALNIGLATQLGPLTESIVRSLTNTHPKDLPQVLQESGIYAEGIMRSLKEEERVKNGVFTKYAPGTLQDVMTKVTSTPGFSPLRNWQIKSAGVASYYDVHSYAKQFAKNQSDKLVLKRLEQYGMGPHDLAQIIQNGGLTANQLEKAVYRGVDRKIFLDTTHARSYNAQRNAFTRAFSMYHGYVSAQAKFMADEFKTSVLKDTRSISGISKFLATAGVVFPAVGEGLKVLEMAGRGQWDQISNELEDDWQGITFQKGDSASARVYHALGTYLEAHAALGSFGVAYGLIQGAQRGYIAQQMAGPMLGSAQKYTDDIVRYGIMHGSWKPAERDALEIGIPLGIGRYAKHKFVPTKSEIERSGGDEGSFDDMLRKVKKEDPTDF